jgi:hypothetical protein
LDIQRLGLHHHDKNFGRSITIKFGSYAKLHYTIQKSHKIAKIPNIPKMLYPSMQRCLSSKRPFTPPYANLHLFLLSKRITRAIQHISSLLDSFGRSVPIFLLDGVADERVDGGFEAVRGIGGEDDVFELCAAGELVFMLVCSKR